MHWWNLESVALKNACRKSGVIACFREIFFFSQTETVVFTIIRRKQCFSVYSDLQWIWHNHEMPPWFSLRWHFKRFLGSDRRSNVTPSGKILTYKCQSILLLKLKYNIKAKLFSCLKCSLKCSFKIFKALLNSQVTADF